MPATLPLVTASVRFITTWPEILSNFQQGKSQVVMNLAQQLDSEWQPAELASSETPLHPRLKLFWKLEASLPSFSRGWRKKTRRL
jgi:hypothetical protein